MDNFIFICDEWGATLGGINSINYDLCLSLAKLEGIRVICVCGQSLSCKEQLDKTSGIEFITIGPVNFKNFNFDRELGIEFGENDTLFWIGHDVITGKQAIAFNDYYKKKFDSVLVIFHHMDYSAYFTARGSAINAKKIIREQNDVFGEADILFGVGPKLEYSLDERNLECDFKGKIYQFKPGLANIKPIERTGRRIKAFVSGRIKADNDNVKQIRLPLIAYNRLLKDGFIPHDSVMYLYGITDELGKEENKLRELCQKEAEAYSNLNALPFGVRDDVFEALRASNVAFMTSLSEGFGLVGFEAVAAGVPLILSKNSGLYELLDSLKLTKYVEVVDIKGSTAVDNDGLVFNDVNEHDIESVKTRLYEIVTHIEMYKKRALELVNLLKQKGYNWEESAIEFCKKLIEYKKDSLHAVDAIRKRSVFISASHDERADECQNIEQVTHKYVNNGNAMLFAKELALELSSLGYRIVSGYGKGIGPAVMAGVFSYISTFDRDYNDLSKYVLTFPFPSTRHVDMNYEYFKRKYREIMCGEVNCVIAIFGFKLEGKIPIRADGIKSDLEIAKENGAMIIPVGSTEFISRELWEYYRDKLDEIYPIKRTDNLFGRKKCRDFYYEELGQEIDFESEEARRRLIVSIILFVQRIWERDDFLADIAQDDISA